MKISGIFNAVKGEEAIHLIPRRDADGVIKNGASPMTRKPDEPHDVIATNRRENVKRLIAAHYRRRADFARDLDRANSQVGQWIHGNRQIGEKLAREIERHFGLPEGSLDREGLPSTPVIVGTAGRKIGAIDSRQTVAVANLTGDMQRFAAVRGTRSVPLVPMRAVRDVVKNNVAEMHSIGFPYRPVSDECSDLSFAVEWSGDANLPDIRDGDELIIDPKAAPSVGDYVLIDAPEEWPEPRVRRLTADGGRRFAVPGNAAWGETPVRIAGEVEILGVVVYTSRKLRRG
jgi:hypothetical protein